MNIDGCYTVLKKKTYMSQFKMQLLSVLIF